TEKLESVEIKNNQLNNKLTEMSGTLLIRENRISELEEEVSLKTSNCNELTEKLESVEIKNIQLNNKLTEMSGTLVTCENRISELVNEVNSKIAANTDLTNQCVSLNSRLNEIDKSSNQVKVEQTKTLRDLKLKEQRVNELEYEINKLTDKITEMNQKYEQINLQNLELEKQNQQTKSLLENSEKLNELNAKLSIKMQVDTENLRTQIIEKTDRIEELTNLIGRLHNKLEKASELYLQLNQEHPELGLEKL
ncbi:hypothetical protein, partial [Glaciecola sp. 1036]|uniref:hypothetical protein n=1 Tax=Alteromonadaceae TaxID=72275 RepID=UPI003D056B4F